MPEAYFVKRPYTAVGAKGYFQSLQATAFNPTIRFDGEIVAFYLRSILNFRGYARYL